MARVVLFSKIVLVLAAIIALATGAFASGPLAARRSDSHIVRPAPSAPTCGRQEGFYRREARSMATRGFQRRRPAQVRWSSRTLAITYYSPIISQLRPALVNAPFFCLRARCRVHKSSRNDRSPRVVLTSFLSQHAASNLSGKRRHVHIRRCLAALLGFRTDCRLSVESCHLCFWLDRSSSAMFSALSVDHGPSYVYLAAVTI